MEAPDAIHAIERLRELANGGASPVALKEATAILQRMESGVSGYLSEKVAATRDSFETWLSIPDREKTGTDPQILRATLLMNIEKLRKALARGTAGQD